MHVGSRKSRGAALLLSASAIALAACADGPESNQAHDRTDQAIQPIIRGTTSGTEHDAVVVLTTFEGGKRRSLCTATLVAPNLIITARHCVSDTDPSTACSMAGEPITGGGVKGDRDPNKLVVFVGKEGVAPNTEVEANGSARGTKLVVESTGTICNRDVAFVVLDRKLTGPVAPIRLGSPSMEETVAAVGWGIDETGSLPKHREVRPDISLIGLGPAMYPDHETYGYGDREFMLGESACAGDSGSPAFAKSGAVVGVAARAGNGKPRDPDNYASTCIGDTAHAVYTHLSSMLDLVTRAFDASGEEMWLEGQPDPRAPRPQTIPEQAPAAPSPSATTPDQAFPPTTVPEEPRAAADSGCTMAPEPRKDAVEHAAGIVAVLALVVGLRRRLTRKDELAELEGTHHDPRKRMPSLP